MRTRIADSSASRDSLPEAFFARYADAILRHVRLRPSLVKTALRTYLDYLAEDLGDTGVAALAAKGSELLRTIADAE